MKYDKEMAEIFEVGTFNTEIINFQSLFTHHQEEILRILNYPKKSMGQENQLEKLEAAKAA